MKLYFEQVGRIEGQKFIADVDTESFGARSKKAIQHLPEVHGP